MFYQPPPPDKKQMNPWRPTKTPQFQSPEEQTTKSDSASKSDTFVSIGENTAKMRSFWGPARTLQTKPTGICYRSPFVNHLGCHQHHRHLKEPSTVTEPPSMPAHTLPVHTPIFEFFVSGKFDGTQWVKAEVFSTQLGLYTISNAHGSQKPHASFCLTSYISLGWRAYGPNQWLDSCLRVPISNTLIFFRMFRQCYFYTKNHTKAKKSIQALRQTK